MPQPVTSRDCVDANQRISLDHPATRTCQQRRPLHLHRNNLSARTVINGAHFLHRIIIIIIINGRVPTIYCLATKLKNRRITCNLKNYAHAVSMSSHDRY